MKKLFILSVILGAILVSAPVLSQKKGTQANVDPEFQKFWGEFSNIVSKGRHWELTQNGYVAEPFIYRGECIGDEFAILLSNFQFDHFINLDAEVKKGIKKFKLSDLTFETKDDETFKFRTNEDDNCPGVIVVKDEYGNKSYFRNYGKHIPNGTKIYVVNLPTNAPYITYKFAKLDGSFKFIFMEIVCVD